ncbi:MAG: phosphocholine cytidylyltransferase family protein [Thermoguttaceae bacterium]|jgi:choline kinase|nr:phosphocholine cytidylyltransferase family protein [Thermoguttaceae bacterium]
MSLRHSRAIILAAGLGNRLRPLTNDRPKCLVDYLGKPIIVQMIEHLASVDVNYVTIVCGYRSDALRERLGKEHAGIALAYIDNPDYAATNSMYSLWLARGQLALGGFLIEGDAVCGPRLFKSLARMPTERAWWAGRAYAGEIDGCVLTAEPQSMRIVRQEIERNPVPGPKPGQYKSTGILSLSADYGQVLAEWLDTDVDAGNVNIYYDLVIGKHLDEKPIHIHDIGAEPWFEIDTVDDLRQAERLFRSAGP